MNQNLRVNFNASAELIDALDAAAFSNDETRAAYVRRILADELRAAGHLALKAPPSTHLGIHNARYRPQGGRT